MNCQIVNRARDRLEAGAMSYGAALYLSRSVQVATLFAEIGYDWLFLDLEHNAMDLETASQIAVTALGAGISPIARVPPKAYALATRLLDAGALGIVMPHVDTADEAVELVRQLRYPPFGGRSYGYASPHFGFRQMPVVDAIDAQNATVLVVAMLETALALQNLEAIAAVPGIDVLMIGPVDLSIDLGLPGQLDHPAIDDACRRIAEACKRHGKYCGIGGVATAEQAARCVERRIQFVLAGGDMAMLTAGATQRLQLLKGTP
jgi:4-hydroxy-2-oxoheptanedioate aldolase